MPETLGRAARVVHSPRRRDPPNVLTQIALDSPDDWHLVGNHSDGVRVYEGLRPCKDSRNLLPFRTTTKVHATLSEIALLHAFDSREECQHYIHMYASDLVDMLPLYTFLERTQEHPLKQTYIKWSAGQSPIGVFADRDFLYLEAQDEVVLADGRRGWAFCQHSIALPSVPTMENTDFKLIRSWMHHTGALFVETETPGVLDLIYNVAVDFKGSMPVWVQKIALKRRAKKICSVKDHVKKMRKLAQVTTPPTTPAHRTHSSCKVCAQPAVSPRSCECCAEAVCEACSRKWRRRGWNSVRLCLDCCPEGQEPPSDIRDLMKKTNTVAIDGPKLKRYARRNEPPTLSDAPGLDLSYLQVYRNASASSVSDSSTDSSPYDAHCIPEETDEQDGRP
ncbi:hypothetical protein SPRG_13865 [Saprolegnia parasitica CBS 223.65]|uniref:START domain-containing protein n=1 Tax=Saprolegnia parasitica (strain CBS 223.65) TaxID=695850 RepID=A0A067C2P6_SAPPC|nr:hypothetical protein SPRG_13865 [Saprolegnia parasitica CBS 223.65]KDO21072.1 hypothetical protein SPRG_13865 [Saprolegnia parasitica CBS 223.65]|eukprot:XP_012208251.1 hypothetical protein SPRG_13865 [Saprolegnia parasitica CBS 223.65]